MVDPGIWFPMFSLTETARNKVLEFIEAEGGLEKWGLAVSAGAGGRYGLDLVELDSLEGVTKVNGVENGKGIQIYIETGSEDKLKGVSVDYVERLSGAGFKFENPNDQRSAYSLGNKDQPAPELTGETATKIKQLFDGEINPALASHGGWVQLLDYKDESGTAYVELGGGCRGCGMVNVTLKSGIEARLKELIPEVKAIVDSTDHDGGSNPFYSPGK